MVHPEVKNWIKYARFEEKHGYIAHSRKVYERAVEFFGEDHIEENLFVAFAKFEEAQKEVRGADCPPGPAWKQKPHQLFFFTVRTCSCHLQILSGQNPQTGGAGALQALHHV